MLDSEIDRVLSALSVLFNYLYNLREFWYTDYNENGTILRNNKGGKSHGNLHKKNH